MKNLKSGISCDMYLRENKELMLVSSPSFGKDQGQEFIENNLATESHVVVDMLEDTVNYMETENVDYDKYSLTQSDV